MTSISQALSPGLPPRDPHWLRRMVCLLRGHNKVHWSQTRCRQEQVFDGVFTPWTCRRCGKSSVVFHRSVLCPP